MSHNGSFLNIFAGFSVFKPSTQVQRWRQDLILILYIGERRELIQILYMSCCARQFTKLEWGLNVNFVPASTACHIVPGISR